MNTSSSNTEQSNNAGAFLGWLPWVAGTLALLLVIGYFVAFRALPLNEKPDAWGQFGDYMGGLLNPLISLFTLIVAVSVWKLQKTELEDTRVALEEQGKTAEQQRREQRFFDLMTVLQRVEDSIVSPDEKSHGKRAIQAYRLGLGHEFVLTCSYGLGQTFLRKTIVFEDLQREWCSSECKTLLTPFFRVICLILSEAKGLLGDQHYQYIELLQAQLSDDEVTAIGLAIWLDQDWVKLKELVCQYGLLKHLSPAGLRQELQSALPIQAFDRTANLSPTR